MISACARSSWTGPPRWARPGVAATTGCASTRAGRSSPARPALSEGHADVPHPRPARRPPRAPRERGGFELLLGTDVARIDPDDGSWEVATSKGELTARADRPLDRLRGAPFTPDWSGRESFEGTPIHAAEYRNPGSVRGHGGAGVGPGCSGWRSRTTWQRAARRRSAVRAHAAQHRASHRPWRAPGDQSRSRSCTCPCAWPTPSRGPGAGWTWAT